MASAVQPKSAQLSRGYFTAAHAYMALTGADGYSFPLVWDDAVTFGSTLSVASTLTVTGAGTIAGGLSVYNTAGSTAVLSLRYNATGGVITLGASNSATPDFIVANNAGTQLYRALTGGKLIIGTGTTATNAGLTVQNGSTDRVALTTNGDIVSMNNNAGLYGTTSAAATKALALINNSNIAVFGADIAATLTGTSVIVNGTTDVDIQFSGTSKIKANTNGVSVWNKTPAAQPDYTITNAVTNRSIDVAAITHAQLAEVVGTLIQDFIDIGWLK